ncbi:MAG: Do family serine endopeptidase [Gammaproteobacteria bacterium]
MSPAFRALLLVAVTATASAALGWRVAGAQAPAAAAPPPQLVAGLPDFTRLVDEVGDGVVAVEAASSGRGAARGGPQLPDDMPEFFRRFFGPGFPMPPAPGAPGMPGGPRGTSMGSGFIISADGYVLTNHHVVEGADEVRVRLSDRREFVAEVVGSDQQSDVALLKIDATGLPALRIGRSEALRPGQWVVAIGSPFGLDHSVTAGIVSAVGRANPYANQRYVPFIQTDVAINRGNSGGPLLDTRGQVVGINSQIFSNSGGYMGVSFAIPIDVAMNAVEQLKAGGRVRRGQLGVSLQPLDNEMARALGLPDARGALVNQVLPDTPAARAGVRPGDVIRSFNGTRVDAWSDLPPMVGALPPGTRVTLEVQREGRTRELRMVLDELDERAAAAPAAAPSPPATHRNPLGIVGEDLDEAARRRLGLEPGEGVAIARVEGLAARRAGLRPGDVILSVGNRPVGSARALDERLSALKSGDTAMLLVRRDGATQFIAVTPRGQAG